MIIFAVIKSTRGSHCKEYFDNYQLRALEEQVASVC